MELKNLLAQFSIKTNNLFYYELAVTHPSCNSDFNTKHNDYERLEFVGDSVIGFVSADLIFKLHPEMDQGYMSKLRSFLVCSKSLANYARKFNFHELVHIGHSISKEQLYKSDKILEDVFEAFIGAIYLDQGFKTAYRIIELIFFEDIKRTETDDIIDAKTRLQEEIQSEYREAVRYEIIDECGPPHDRTFWCQVIFNGIILGKGQGKTKKAAEEAAAKDALSKRSL